MPLPVLVFFCFVQLLFLALFTTIGSLQFGKDFNVGRYSLLLINVCLKVEPVLHVSVGQ